MRPQDRDGLEARTPSTRPSRRTDPGRNAAGEVVLRRREKHAQMEKFFAE
jgi:hypothetical protein